MLRETDIAGLSIGMYVSELDRPWLGTPFPVQGFYVRTSDDIERIGEVCRYVLVDPRRFDYQLAAAADASAPVMDEGSLELPPRAVDYDESLTVEEELPHAREALNEGVVHLRRFWTDLSARRKVSIQDLQSALDPLVDSVLRNKDALAALVRVQRTDSHTHEHCLAMAVWASLLGRELGLAPHDVKALALGCSLIDVGMVCLPRAVLDPSGPRSRGDEAVYRSHVDFSLEMLARMGAEDRDLQQTVRWHHERMDGGGYPDGLAGGTIPVYARIAAIADNYDSLISPRDPSLARSSFEALTELQDRCPAHFQAELMEQFSRAVGIFPSGSLVELNTGEIAVVFAQNTGRRLRPKVVLILDREHRRRPSCPIVDLNGEHEQGLRISRELAHNEYGIDAREFFL